MEIPLSCLAQDDDRSQFTYDRSLMASTPPPSYSDAVFASRKHGDPWIARMNSLDETVLEMRRAVQETQSMMMGMQAQFQTKSDAHDSKQDRSDNDGNDDDSLDRITESLQQLIEQAQVSLTSKMTIKDKSAMMRSNSCPHMSAIYNEERRQSEATAALAPQPFDWNDQRQRYHDSQTRLTRAVDELTGLISGQDNLSMQNITVHHEHHHIHEHHHVHYHSQSDKNLSRMLTLAWSSLRHQLSSSAPTAQQPTPLVIHPPHIHLSKANLLRFMLYISLLIFSFMNHHPSQLQLSKQGIAARRCLGVFVGSASDTLPITTWLQRSTLIVYITNFI